MAEETELIRVAFQGTDMFLRLAGAGVKEGLKFLKFLLTAAPNTYRWWQETADKALKKKLTKAEYKIIKNKQKVVSGSMDLNKFMKVFGSEERTLLQIPYDSARNFADLAEKNNLTYAVMPDLNPVDGMFQIMVPNQQADIYKLILESMIKEEIKRNEETVKELRNELQTVEKERAACVRERKAMESDGRTETEPEKYQELIDRIDELNLTREQITDEIEKVSHLHSGEITYEDYMKTNPFAINHTDMYAEMLDEGIEPQQITKLEDFLVFIQKNKNVNGQEVSFENAVTDVAKLVDTGKEIVITDADHPENYIRASSYVKEYENGEPFVCSEYNVYYNGLKQKCNEFKHGEFLHFSDGKSVNKSDAGNEHWINMKKEMQEKSGLGSEVLVFNSLKEYEIFANKSKEGIVKGTEYFVSQDVPNIAIRRDELGTTANRYILLKNGEETKLVYDITKDTTPEIKEGYIRTINNEVRRENPEADLSHDWMFISGEAEFNNFAQIAKKKTMDKEELKREFEQAVGKEAEPIKETLKVQEEISGNVLILPQENLMVQENEREHPDTYFVYSGDMNYQIEIPVDKVKVDSLQNRIVILKEGESLEATERNGTRTYPVTCQKDMNAFLQNTEVFAKSSRSKAEERKSTTKSKNSFNAFNQRSYDYDESFEKQLLGNGMERK